MKFLISLLVFVLVLFMVVIFPGKSTHSDQTPPVDENVNLETGESQVETGTTGSPSFDDSLNIMMGTGDEEPLDYYPDVFLRKLEQKKLPPLTKQEKITWSFRLAKSNPFL